MQSYKHADKATQATPDNASQAMKNDSQVAMLSDFHVTGVLEHRMFHVVEILEALLAQLPTRDLLLSKRVKKTWRDTINGSKKCQQALFLKPAATERLKYNCDAGT